MHPIAPARPSPNRVPSAGPPRPAPGGPPRRPSAGPGRRLPGVEAPPSPRLARLLAAGGAPVAAAAFRRLAATPGAAAAEEALRVAALRVEALGLGGHLQPDASVPPTEPPGPLTAPVTVDVGLRPLLGELAWACLEAGRPADAVRLFGALETLAPDRAAGGIGQASAYLAAGLPEAAVVAARRAVAAEATPVALAALAEALVFAGEPDAARAAVARARGAMGPAASWLRLLRVGLDEGWLPAAVAGAAVASDAGSGSAP